ncbi:hypothetical protein AAG906_041172 [Vitis piasezkii]
MNIHSYGSGSPKSFHAYPRGDFDLESGSTKKTRKPKSSPFQPIKMLKSLGTRIHYYYKLHPLVVFFISLSFGLTVLIILSVYESQFRAMSNYQKLSMGYNDYPFTKLQNLVMVAGHSVFTSSSCGKVDKEDSWFLESYQKHPDDGALLLFSGGETRKDAGPRSEAQSYWAVAESEGWFGQFLSLSFSSLFW